ncbi:MAG: hypothetical protein GY809_06275 [Planctomycetes bacterium]|nr:hypothetical protein [Planctomycetota bacterium]
MKTMARLAASRHVACSRQETARVRIKLMVVFVGMACILASRFSRISAWDFIMIAVMLVVIVKKMQARDDVIRDVRHYSLKRRLAVGIGILVFLIVFFNASFAMKLMLSSLVAMACLGRWKPTYVSEPASETPAEPSITQEPEDAPPTEALCDTAPGLASDQVTLSYAHPVTGMFHVDAALSVYVSAEDGPPKARARRIIMAHLTRVPAFSTGNTALDDTLKHVVTSDDSQVLATKLKAIADHVNDPAVRQSEAFEKIRDKVLTVLGITKLIARNPEERALLEQGEDAIKHI